MTVIEVGMRRIVGIVRIVRGTHLGVEDRQSIYPDPPASRFQLQGVVMEQPKQLHDQIRDAQLRGIRWVDVSQREQPILPYGHL